MVKVLKHGDRIIVTNPQNRHQQTEMIKVTFIEEGRQGANVQVANSTTALNRALGTELMVDETTGIPVNRTHTQPIAVNQIHHFPIGREINDLFINRSLFSTPQVRQQQSTDTNEVLPRMIKGRPTFFLTELDNAPKDDEDHRLSNDILATIHPEYFSSRIVSQSAPVQTVEVADPMRVQREMDLVQQVVTTDDWLSDRPDGGASLAQDGADFTGPQQP